MTDYRNLSEDDKSIVDNEYKVDTHLAPLEDMHSGEVCTKCWRYWYICLCSHDN